MALIKCKECGKEISDQATTCPNCGAKTETANKKQEQNTYFIFAIISMIITVIAFFINPYGLLSIIAITFSIVCIIKIKQNLAIRICCVLFTLINIFNIYFIFASMYK